MKKPKKAELFKGRDGKWRFRIVGGNGEIIAQSQAYFSKWNAKRAVIAQYQMTPVVV